MRVAAAGLGALTTIFLLSGCIDEQLAPAPTPDAVAPPTSCQDVLYRHPTKVERIAVGSRTACVVNNRGGMYCWGDNALGAAGQPDLIGSTCQPWKAPWHECLRTVGLSAGHGCGLTYDGRVLCWGQNTYGQLGVPSAAGGPEPVEVVLSGPVVQVAAGGAQGAALLSDGTVWLWGDYASFTPYLAEPARPFPELVGIKALPQSGPPFGALAVHGRALCWSGTCGNEAETMWAVRPAVRPLVRRP